MFFRNNAGIAVNVRNDQSRTTNHLSPVFLASCNHD
jgi:hypothetical protein